MSALFFGIEYPTQEDGEEKLVRELLAPRNVEAVSVGHDMECGHKYLYVEFENGDGRSVTKFEEFPTLPSALHWLQEVSGKRP